jgi:hypothetical protein
LPEDFQELAIEFKAFTRSRNKMKLEKTGDWRPDLAGLSCVIVGLTRVTR